MRLLTVGRSPVAAADVDAWTDQLHAVGLKGTMQRLTLDTSHLSVLQVGHSSWRP